jgi:hypothetical protein
MQHLGLLVWVFPLRALKLVLVLVLVVVLVVVVHPWMALVGVADGNVSHGTVVDRRHYCHVLAWGERLERGESGE